MRRDRSSSDPDGAEKASIFCIFVYLLKLFIGERGKMIGVPGEKKKTDDEVQKTPNNKIREFKRRQRLNRR